MASWRPIPLGMESYQPRSGTQSIERLVNLYVEATKQPGGKTAYSLHGTPGLKAWTTVGDGPIRGIHYAWGYFWVVSGDELYAVNAATKAAQRIGEIAGVGPVRTINDATYVVVCANHFAYVANLTGITTLPEANLSGAAYQDGYGLYVQRNTQFLWRSGLDNLVEIPATGFTSADAKSDNVIAVISDQREVWVFKESTVEIYYNTGATFPFERVGGGFIERGCKSPGSVAAAETLVFWLGDDLKVYQAAGYNAEPISNPAIERMIADAYSPETSEAFTYAQAGHTFYVLTFADLTICYDLTTRKWHERKSYGLDRWRVHGYARSGSLSIVGNYDGPDLYELDIETYDEDGEILEWQVIDPPLSADPLPISVHEMHLDCEMGVGLTSGQGSAPVTLLSWSDDDGRTWSNDVELSLGAIGLYRNRATATRLGRSHNRSHRWRGSDPVKRAIHGRSARIERLAA
jgi:hypothetical protein